MLSFKEVFAFQLRILLALEGSQKTSAKSHGLL